MVGCVYTYHDRRGGKHREGGVNNSKLRRPNAHNANIYKVSDIFEEGRASRRMIRVQGWQDLPARACVVVANYVEDNSGKRKTVI